jgi:hypothetical protein
MNESCTASRHRFANSCDLLSCIEGLGMRNPVKQSEGNPLLGSEKENSALHGARSIGDHFFESETSIQSEPSLGHKGTHSLVPNVDPFLSIVVSLRIVGQRRADVHPKEPARLSPRCVMPHAMEEGNLPLIPNITTCHCMHPIT